MAAEKLARFTLLPSAGPARGIFILFLVGRSFGRPLSHPHRVGNHLGWSGRPAHSFSAGSVARKNFSDDGCDAESNSACMRRRSLLPLPLPLPMSLHQARLAPDGRTRRSAYCPSPSPVSGIFGLPELHYYSFWHQILLLRQQTDTQIDAPVWHLAVTLGATTAATGLFSVLRHPPCANVQMTRDESVRDPRPKNGSAANAPVPGCPLARWQSAWPLPLPTLHSVSVGCGCA